MRTVSLKLKKSIIKEIDALSKIFHYNTKTEFIREAIRDKIKELEIEIFMRKIKKFKGISKTKTSDKELEKIRRCVTERYLKKLDNLK